MQIFKLKIIFVINKLHDKQKKRVIRSNHVLFIPHTAQRDNEMGHELLHSFRSLAIICIGPVQWTRKKKAFNANADRNNNTHTYGTTWNANLHFLRQKRERTVPESFPKMIFYDKIVSVGS